MATSLSFITNASYTALSGKKALNELLQKLKDSNIEHCADLDHPSKKEQGNWRYRYFWYSQPLSVNFEGPFCNTPEVFANCTLVLTIYRYYLLYRNYDTFFFREYRQEVFDLVRLLGGTEIIWLSDQTNVLWEYEQMVYNNSSYQEIKDTITKNLGEPITNYRELNYDTLDYHKIGCWVLDDFEDLKNGTDAYKDCESLMFG